MLTDKQIRGIKPTAKHQFIPDIGGVYLRVHPSGKKQFLYRSRVGGKARYVIIGDYPEVSLLTARLRASTIDLGDKNVVSVDNLFDAFYKHLTTQYKNPGLVKAKYDKDIKPVLGAKDVKSVTRADISDVLQAIIDRGSNVMANRTLADIKHMFRFAVERGWVDHNPAELLTRKSVGGKEVSRDKVLSRDEIVKVIQFCLTPRFDYKTRLAVWVMLLTGQRATEVLGIQTGEVRGVWWNIPKERTKAKRATKVYLSPQSRAALALADGTFGSDHRVLSKAFKRMEFDFTPHDLRRTMATYLADMGVAPHVIERMLNHQMGGVMAVYNRAEYLTERREAWRLWGRYLSKLRREVRRLEPLPS